MYVHLSNKQDGENCPVKSKCGEKGNTAFSFAAHNDNFLSNNDLSNQISNENSGKWNGKVALVTLSEYIRSNSNQSNCGTLALQIRNYSSCVNTGWMDTRRVSEWWTLSPSVTNSTYSYYVVSNGQIGNDKVYGVNSATGVYPAVRPATYLSSKVKITGGNGSSSNPYMIE